MKRTLRLVMPLAVSALLVIVFAACDDDAGAACTNDRDCNTGQICRDELCFSLGGPGGAFVDADPGTDTAPFCSNDGVPCTLATECCSNQCVQNTCGPQPGGNPTCKQQLESCLSSDECCQPYSCTKGLCR